MGCLSLFSSCPLSSPKLYGSPSPSISCRRQFSTAVSCRATRQTATCGNGSSNCNFYSVLSLTPKSATTDEIKRAYRSMALRYHPDVCHSSSKEESTEKFVLLNEAYKTLSNPSLRQEYDDCVMGLRSRMEESRKRWQNQIAELKRRAAGSGMEGKTESWGSRMRTKNKESCLIYS